MSKKEFMIMKKKKINNKMLNGWLLTVFLNWNDRKQINLKKIVVIYNWKILLPILNRCCKDFILFYVN